MNFIQLVGKLVKKPCNKASDKVSSAAELELEVCSNFLEPSNQYHRNIFRVRVWKGVHTEAMQHWDVGIFLAIKGRLEIENNAVILIAEQYEVIR